MKEKGLNPRPRRRSVRTTDGDHGVPIFPFIYKIPMFTAQTSCGGRPDLHPHPPGLRLCGADTRRLGVARRCVYRRPQHRCPPGGQKRSAMRSRSGVPSRLRVLHGPRISVRVGTASRNACRKQRHRLDEQTRESVRQRPSRELHQDTEGGDAYLMACETVDDVAIGLPRFIEAYSNWP